MKLSIALVVLVFLVVGALSAAAFDGFTLVVVVVAMVIVTVFGLAPVAFGVLTRRAERAARGLEMAETVRLGDNGYLSDGLTESVADPASPQESAGRIKENDRR